MNTGSSLYYDGFGSLENSSPKEMGSGRSFYYYGYGSWDLTKTILSMKALKEVEKK